MRPTAEQLAVLAPLAGLSRERLGELAAVAAIERAPRGSDGWKVAMPQWYPRPGAS